MLKEKLTWKRPLFYVLLPILLVMVFLGFPLPVAPPPVKKPAQEQSVVVRKRKKDLGLLVREKGGKAKP